MEITAMALALMVLGLVAGCLQWSLLLRFDEFYPADGFSHTPTVRLLFWALTGLATAGIFAVLFLTFHKVVVS